MYKSTSIRDDRGVLWRWSPEKKRVKSEEDNDVFGGFHANTFKDAIRALQTLGYIKDYKWIE